MSTDKMQSKKEGSVGHLIFNNPERHNAVSFEMWEAAEKILDDFESDENVRVVVLSGTGGKAFVSGADISKFESERGSQEAVLNYNAMTARVYTRLHEFPKPTIAMIRGYCIGGGLALGVCCDLRICTPKSQFGLPAAKLALGYPFAGLKRLADCVGPAHAKQITFTGDRMNAERAQMIGLVNEIVADEELEEFVKGFADNIAGNAPMTVGAMKFIYSQVVKDPGDRDLDKCQAMVDACFASDDYVEGRKAFMEKRKPQFKGA